MKEKFIWTDRGFYHFKTLPGLLEKGIFEMISFPQLSAVLDTGALSIGDS
jgi:hypothetical protein